MKRRLATLATIARLDDRRLRQSAAELLPLQDKAARLDAEARELDRRRQQESAITLIEAMPYLGRFLATLKRETDRITQDRATLESAIDAKRQEVLAAWRDLRAKEHLQHRIHDRAQAVRIQAEQAEMDERGVLSHARRARLNRRQAVPD